MLQSFWEWQWVWFVWFKMDGQLLLFFWGKLMNGPGFSINMQWQKRTRREEGTERTTVSSYQNQNIYLKVYACTALTVRVCADQITGSSRYFLEGKQRAQKRQRGKDTPEKDWLQLLIRFRLIWIEWKSRKTGMNGKRASHKKEARVVYMITNVIWSEAGLVQKVQKFKEFESKKCYKQKKWEFWMVFWKKKKIEKFFPEKFEFWGFPCDIFEECLSTC